MPSSSSPDVEAGEPGAVEVTKNPDQDSSSDPSSSPEGAASSPAIPPTSAPASPSPADRTDEPPPASERESDPPPPPPAAGGFLGQLRDRFLGIDRRTLGLFRLFFGSVLLIDTLRRLGEATFFYSNEGVLSNHFALFSPPAKPLFSFFFAFSTPREAQVALLLCAASHFFYLLGHRTRLFQVLSFVAYTSLNARTIFVEGEGSTLICLLLAWTMFLPLGDRFSLDALRRSLASRQEFKAAALNDRTPIFPDTSLHLSLAALAVLLQIILFHGLHLFHQSGETWRSGEAVHWILWQNRLVTPLGGWLRLHAPAGLFVGLTRLLQLIEGAAPLLVVVPFAQRFTRLGLFLSTTLLALGMVSLVNLGPLPYAIIALHLLALPPETLDRLAAWLRAGKERRTVVYDPTDAGLHFVARLLSRLDLFERLRFLDNSDTAHLPAGTPKATIATLHRGSWTKGTGAIASAARSLPLGSLLGPVLAGGVGQGLLRSILLRRQRWVAAYGLEAGRKATDKGPLSELPDDPTPLALQVTLTLSAMRESCVFVLLLAAGFSAVRESSEGATRRELPAALRPIVDYPRLSQSWNLFAPDASRQDGTLVIDGTTSGGRHLDPLTGEAPDFDTLLHAPHSQGQLRGDYLQRILAESNRPYREEFRRYLLNWQKLEGLPPQDRLVSFEAFWVTSDSPAPGQTTPTSTGKIPFFNSR